MCFALLRGFFWQSWFASHQVSVTSFITLNLPHLVSRQLFCSSLLNTSSESAPCCRSYPAPLPQLPASLLPVFHPFLLGKSVIFISFPNAPAAGRITESSFPFYYYRTQDVHNKLEQTNQVAVSESLLWNKIIYFFHQDSHLWPHIVYEPWMQFVLLDVCNAVVWDGYQKIFLITS